MTRYLAGSWPRILAHRGWHTGELTGFENSLAAFRRAADEGIEYVETDVHATADGRLIAFHDTVLDRVTDSQGPIAQQTWDQIRRAKIGGREPIPLLEQVLTALPNTRFNIDAKSDAAVGPLLDVLHATGAADRVCVASFSSARLGTLRQALGVDVASALAPSEALRMVSRIQRSHRDGVVAAQVPASWRHVRIVTPRFIARAHRFGLEVHVWTINDAATMHQLLDLGVDGIVTDRPDVLKSVLADRACQSPATGLADSAAARPITGVPDLSLE